MDKTIDINFRYVLGTGEPLKASLRRLEREVIKHALRVSGGSVSNAASLIGMTHQTLSLAIRDRHPELERERTERVPRRRSIIKR